MFPLYEEQTLTSQVPCIPIVDWTNPLSKGLVAAYAPGVTFGTNLVRGYSPNLNIFSSSRTTSNSPEGQGDYGVPAGNGGWIGNADLAQYSWSSVALFVRFFYNAAAAGGTPNYFGLTYTNSATSPYDLFDIGISSGTNHPRLALNDGTNPQAYTLNTILTVGSMHDIFATWDTVGGAINAFVDGALDVNTTLVATPKVATPQIIINCFPGVTTAGTGAVVTAAYLWIGPLVGQNYTIARKLHANPYVLIRPMNIVPFVFLPVVTLLTPQIWM